MRPPSDDPRLHTVCVRLTDVEKADLDVKRGSMPASDFIRRKLFGRQARPKKA